MNFIKILFIDLNLFKINETLYLTIYMILIIYEHQDEIPFTTFELPLTTQ